jgi:hypothetical protein
MIRGEEAESDQQVGVGMGRRERRPRDRQPGFKRRGEERGQQSEQARRRLRRWIFFCEHPTLDFDSRDN